MGQAEHLKINLDVKIEQRLSQPAYAAVAQPLGDIGVNSAVDLVSTFTAQKSDLASWLQGADINHDWIFACNTLQAGASISDLEDSLYREMLRYRRSPAQIFLLAPRVKWRRFSPQCPAN